MSDDRYQPPFPYLPRQWYWLTGNTGAQVFSSAVGIWLDPGDAGYNTWLAQGYLPSRCACDGELADVLLKAGLPDATVLACGAKSYGILGPSDIEALVAIGLLPPS